MYLNEIFTCERVIISTKEKVHVYIFLFSYAFILIYNFIIIHYDYTVNFTCFLNPCLET